MEHVIGKTLRLREDLTLVSLEDKASLLDVDRRCYFDPNDTASFLLKLMETGYLYEDLMATFLSEFDVAEERARVEVDSFVEELLKLRLLDIGEATAHKIVREPKGEKKAYQAPLFGKEALPALVASGSTTAVTVK